MASLLEGLKEMARTLYADPDIHVEAWTEPAHGVSKADLKKAEATLGAKLPAELCSFYEEMDGFGIVWVHRDDWEVAQPALVPNPKDLKRYPTFEKLRTLTLHTRKRLKWPFPTTTKAQDRTFDSHAGVGHFDHRATGYLRVSPLARLLKHPDYAAIIKGLKGSKPPITSSFDGEDVPAHELYARFAVLDAYSASEAVLLYTGPGPRHMRVHRMPNSYELSEGDRHLGLADYFSAVTKAQGRVSARKPLFDGR